LFCFLPAGRAAAATAVSIGRIDYEKLTMQVYYNNNSIVYYSTDNSNWSEVEGDFDTSTKSCEMDISWVSETNDVTLYLKGDVVKTVKTVTLPAQNTTFEVTYNKAECDFEFENAEEAETFEWRKATDYTWSTVDIDEDSASYQKFMNKVEMFMVKGAAIVIRIPQVTGSDMDDVGLRPSIAKTVTITGRAASPTITVNSSRLTLNTTSSMEYYDPVSDLWIECTGNMSLYEIAPEALFENGSSVSTIRIRKAATTSAPYSKTAYVKIPGQSAAPTIGDSSADVTYYYMNSKLVLQFNHASGTKIYQYAVIKEDMEFDAATANWRDVKSSDTLTLSGTYAPSGCMVYVRKKGTDAGTGNMSDLILASAAGNFIVKY
jgi:hypothetical protein